MTDISFEGQVVVVTGAGGGIGRTYALDIARRGGAVVVNDTGGDIFGYNPGPEMADSVVSEIKSFGGKAIASYDTVATRESAGKIIDKALAEFGRLDAVINNAGIMRNALIEEATEEDIEATLSVHLLGTLNITRAAWPHMKKQGYGRVVCTASTAGLLGNYIQSAYGAAKAGVAGLVNVLSIEGEPHGILCNGILPNAQGRMGVQMQKDLGEEPNSERTKDLWAVVGESLNPEFNTGLGVYLASNQCQSTHAFYSSCLGRYARVFVGIGEGWQSDREKAPLAEDIAEHFDQICDLSRGYDMPINPRDEIAKVLAKST